MATLTIDPTKEAETITEILKDESPLVNWLVEWDSSMMSFRIRANVLIGSVPVGAGCYLALEHYQQGVWLERMRAELIYLIAQQLLKKPGN